MRAGTEGGTRPLKLHSLHFQVRRRGMYAETRRTEPFDLPAGSRDAQLSARKRLLAALMDENSRLVDQLRSVMRELQSVERLRDDLRTTPAKLREQQ
jgi:hypothetical protein